MLLNLDEVKTQNSLSNDHTNHTSHQRTIYLGFRDVLFRKALLPRLHIARVYTLLLGQLGKERSLVRSVGPEVFCVMKKQIRTRSQEEREGRGEAEERQRKSKQMERREDLQNRGGEQEGDGRRKAEGRTKELYLLGVEFLNPDSERPMLGKLSISARGKDPLKYCSIRAPCAKNFYE